MQVNVSAIPEPTLILPDNCEDMENQISAVLDKIQICDSNAYCPTEQNEIQNAKETTEQKTNANIEIWFLKYCALFCIKNINPETCRLTYSLLQDHPKVVYRICNKDTGQTVIVKIMSCACPDLQIEVRAYKFLQLLSQHDLPTMFGIDKAHRYIGNISKLLGISPQFLGYVALVVEDVGSDAYDLIYSGHPSNCNILETPVNLLQHSFKPGVKAVDVETNCVLAGSIHNEYYVLSWTWSSMISEFVELFWTLSLLHLVGFYHMDIALENIGWNSSLRKFSLFDMGASRVNTSVKHMTVTYMNLTLFGPKFSRDFYVHPAWNLNLTVDQLDVLWANGGVLKIKPSQKIFSTRKQIPLEDIDMFAFLICIIEMILGNHMWSKSSVHDHQRGLYQISPWFIELSNLHAKYGTAPQSSASPNEIIFRQSTSLQNPSIRVIHEHFCLNSNAEYPSALLSILFCIVKPKGMCNNLRVVNFTSFVLYQICCSTDNQFLVTLTNILFSKFFTKKYFSALPTI